MSEEKWKITYQLSSVAQTLENATDLKRLSQKHPAHEKLLSACAVLVFASALEQGLKDALKFWQTARTSAEGTDLHDSSFRSRMIKLPGLISGGRFEFPKRRENELVDALHRLINYRNELMHIDDDNIWEREIYPVKTEDQQNGKQKIVLKHPDKLPKNPWDFNHSQELDLIERAINAYLYDVFSLNCEPTESEPKLLVRRYKS